MYGVKALHVFTLLCDLVLCLTLFLFCCFWLPVGSNSERAYDVLGGPWSRMASKASSSKGGEELVGQALARSLWAQDLAEEEAELKKAGAVCFSFHKDPGKMSLKNADDGLSVSNNNALVASRLQSSSCFQMLDMLQILFEPCVRCAML